LPIQIITATPGPTTAERIFDLLLAHPQGMTVKDLSQRLNRPVSMVQHCLKHLMAAEAVCAQFSEDGRQWLYYPSATSYLDSLKSCYKSFSPSPRLPVSPLK
jgi:predicted transcriptional regulator